MYLKMVIDELPGPTLVRHCNLELGPTSWLAGDWCQKVFMRAQPFEGYFDIFARCHYLESRTATVTWAAWLPYTAPLFKPVDQY